MRITFLGNFQVDYSSETHHKKSLEALGHTVVALQERNPGHPTRHDATTETILSYALKSDLFVWVHTHNWRPIGKYTMEAVLQRLKEAGIPSVTYHLDLWFGLDRQRDLTTDKFYGLIDHFFTVDKKMADWFNENTSVKGHYLPAGVFHEEMLLDSNIQKVNDIIFVGSRGYHHEWPYRPQLIDWLHSEYKDRFRHVGGDGTGVVRGHALTGLYNATKVVVGDSLCLDFNYPYYWSDRLYETIGRGGFIIFPQITGIQDEFVTYDFKVDDGMFWDKAPADVELVTYEFGNFNMLRERINYFLTHDEEREKIRKAGYERCKNYTYVKRWETILKEVGLNG